MKNINNKKYCMIVYAEDERYRMDDAGCDFYSPNPVEGILNDIVYGNNAEELMESTDGHDNNGLFYVLYVLDVNNGIATGSRFSFGTVFYDGIAKAINNYECQSKRKLLEKLLGMELTDAQEKAIMDDWAAFYDDPKLYANGIMIDCVKRYLAH